MMLPAQYSQDGQAVPISIDSLSRADHMKQVLELLEVTQGSATGFLKTSAGGSQQSTMDDVSTKADAKSQYSTGSRTSTKPGTESTYSDSDNGSGSTTPPTRNTVLPPPGLAVQACPPASPGEPMKVQMPSFATPEGPSQNLRDGLQESLLKLVQQLQLQQQQEQTATAALQHLASARWHQELMWQRSVESSMMQMQSNAAMMPPPYMAAPPLPQDLCQSPYMATPPPQGLGQMPAAGNSPLVPYLLAELANRSKNNVPLPAQPSPYGPDGDGKHRQKGNSHPPGSTTIDISKSLRTDGGSVGKGSGKGKGNKGATRSKGADRSKGAVDKDRKTGSSVKQDVRDADRPRTLVCLKVNRLGFDAEKELIAHCSQFGKVDYVFVPLKVKRVHATATTPSHSHLRPSGLGFVVMAKEEDTQAIIASGAEQLVNGKVISVRAFKQGLNEEDNDLD